MTGRLRIGRAAALLIPLIAAASGCHPRGEPVVASAATVSADLTDRPWSAYENLPLAVKDKPHTRKKRRPGFGPPPPGYVRILGEAVPGWTPESMHGVRPRGVGWQPLGPRPIENEFWSGSARATGRFVSIAVHPTSPNLVYAASASGGIWKTTDAGGAWTPMTDELSNLNHGHVALDPSNPDVVYAGTGEYTTDSRGDGLFRSTDGGVNWTRIATTAQVGTSCSGIIVDPSDSQRIYVAGDIGLVRSTDGGESWSVRIPGACSSIAIHNGTPATVWAGMQNDGIYRTRDSGDTWNLLVNGLPGANVARIVLASGPAAPATVYAAIVNFSGDLQGMYKTTSGGNGWTRLNNTPDFPSPQGWYDCCVGVDPTDSDIVYAGGVFPDYAVAGVIRSDDGGASWTDITRGPESGQLHPDQHAIAFGSDGTLWIGNDGGVWKSSDSGQSWANTNATLTATQNYNIALHPTDPAQVIAGTQDNGTVGREMDTFSWPQVVPGDGGFLAYDYSQPSRRYTTYVYLTVFRIDGDDDYEEISGPWGGEPRNFIAPLVMDPSNSSTLLGGTNRVWRTTNADGAANWSAISPTSVGGGGTLNAIAVASGQSNTIYCGSSTGRLSVTTNASTWTNRSAGLPAGQISDILVDPQAPGTAYVSFHNTGGPRILRTTDLGETWTSVTGNLPGGVSAKALAIDWRFDPPDLYVGTGVGVYESHDGGQTWIKDGLDLPNVNIGDLLIDPIRETITAGTYGRGAWRKDLRALPCVGDVNNDDVVDLSDLATLLSNFGITGGATHEQGDLNADGNVDLADLATLLSNFGGTC